MNYTEIAANRLSNQQISHPHFSDSDKLVHWMGALQAQDYEMAKWAIGIRLPGSTKKSIEKAISEGSIIRTHLLRPTWHFVAAKDLRWILQISGPRIKISLQSRQKQLGLTKDLISKSHSIIEKALADTTQITRSELVLELENGGFKNKNNLASHLLICAELDGVICSGPSQGKNYTYALFEKRIPSSNKLTKEEALAKLAEIYFKRRGPATLDDFNWWSGLTKTQAKKATNLIKDDLYSEKVDSHTYWFSDSSPLINEAKKSVHLLPAYDEFLISYKDRTASIRIKDQKKAISNNGIFRPLIVQNGEVIGIWKRSVKKNSVYVETQLFKSVSNEIIHQIEESAGNFVGFLEKDLEITHIIE